MADTQDKVTLASLNQRLETAEAKIAALEGALETALSATPSAAPAKAPAAPALTGEPFKVAGRNYRAKYPKFNFEGRDLTEADLLADTALQAKLVQGGYGVIEEVAA